MNALVVMEIERECVHRASQKHCNRNCEACDLVLPDDIVLGAYDTVIRMLKNKEHEEDDLK